MVSAEKLRERILTATRKMPADLVLKGGLVVNVFTGGIRVRDVAVKDGFIAGVGEGYEGLEEVDLRGRWVVPGLMDGHVHIESSMLLPSRLAGALIPHGTTAVVSDPHEIANVLGVEGVRFLLRESEDLPMDVFFTAPACVPATTMETSGAELDARVLESLRREPRVVGLAEVMNFPGVCAGDLDLLKKIESFQDRALDGHCPGLSSHGLQAYVAAGIRSEHECSTLEEALEKVDAGMFVMIREGTLAKNLEALIPAVTPWNAGRFCFVSDDLAPREILGRGHLDHMIRKAVRFGMEPALAVRLASLNPACFYGFRDRGAVAAGFRADVVVLEDLEAFETGRVYKDGRLVFRKGDTPDFGGLLPNLPRQGPLPTGPLDKARFKIPDKGGVARVMELVPGQLTTTKVLERPRVVNGEVVSDTEHDILKIAVVERHHATGNTGLGLVRGFGLKAGALAGSVSHDSHNIIGVGVEDGDLLRAVEEVRDMGGGLTAVLRGEVLARVPLKIGGLLSTQSIDDLARELEDLDRAATSLGCGLKSPFMALSFLALPVIPVLKLTDRGLVDVDLFRHVPLFADEKIV